MAEETALPSIVTSHSRANATARSAHVHRGTAMPSGLIGLTIAAISTSILHPRGRWAAAHLAPAGLLAPGHRSLRLPGPKPSGVWRSLTVTVAGPRRNRTGFPYPQ